LPSALSKVDHVTIYRPPRPRPGPGPAAPRRHPGRLEAGPARPVWNRRTG